MTGQRLRALLWFGKNPQTKTKLDVSRLERVRRTAFLFHLLDNETTKQVHHSLSRAGQKGKMVFVLSDAVRQQLRPRPIGLRDHGKRHHNLLGQNRHTDAESNDSHADVSRADILERAYSHTT